MKKLGEKACYIIFIFSVLFSVTNTASLFFMIVMLPLHLKVRNKYFIGKTLITAVIFILAISATAVILYKETETFLPTSLCSPFNHPSNTIFLIKFLSIGIGILQLSASVYICLIYAVLIIILHSYTGCNSNFFQFNMLDSLQYNLYFYIIYVKISNRPTYLDNNSSDTSQLND